MLVRRCPGHKTIHLSQALKNRRLLPISTSQNNPVDGVLWQVVRGPRSVGGQGSPCPISSPKRRPCPILLIRPVEDTHRLVQEVQQEVRCGRRSLISSTELQENLELVVLNLPITRRGKDSANPIATTEDVSKL